MLRALKIGDVFLSFSLFSLLIDKTKGEGRDDPVPLPLCLLVGEFVTGSFPF